MPYIGNPIYQSAFVTDQFSGTGSATTFTMSVAPAGVSNVLVAVSGVLQDPSTYGVAGTTITFSTAPPPGTGNISCRYLGVPVTGITTTAYRTVTEFTATAGQTTFTPPSYTPSFINVYLNGVLLGSADYTATNGTTVVLTTGAAVGNLVTIESFQVSSVLNAIPATSGSILLSGSYVTGTLPVANGGTGVTTSTGTGSVVLSAAPTLTGQATIPTINLTGGQIAFPATQNPSSDANTLDDYEEGTWTPVINGSSSAGTASYSQQTGWYTKIGNVVTIGLYVNFSSATGTGSLLVAGLPFASSGTYLVTGSLMTGNIDWPNGYTMATLYKPPGTSYFETYCSADNLGWTLLQMEPAGEMLGGCTYRI
jgi:hypothetical protein